MKKKSLLFPIILIIIIILLILTLTNTNVNPPEIKNCTSYSTEDCPNECFICPPCKACSSISCQSKEFCNSIGFDESWSNTQRKTYCTPEQKKAQICPQYYSATCGWFDKNVNCFKYPCASTFSNPCEACSSENVEFYTIGKCPE